MRRFFFGWRGRRRRLFLSSGGGLHRFDVEGSLLDLLRHYEIDWGGTGYWLAKCWLYKGVICFLGSPEILACKLILNFLWERNETRNNRTRTASTLQVRRWKKELTTLSLKYVRKTAVEQLVEQTLEPSPYSSLCSSRNSLSPNYTFKEDTKETLYWCTRTFVTFT